VLPRVLIGLHVDAVRLLKIGLLQQINNVCMYDSVAEKLELELHTLGFIKQKCLCEITEYFSTE